ncbi:hypothetical protein N657DRAFT_692120 [Parathielavia appendiculata]|uniref:Uncharacterized protein n=1 Tax=Parathielavia appendiculata TaxID=2587402 RepID=A0AAN6Z169_9PEZI|nr:hypothetical protein N657DRAFT_692120 [Parathielavia appendiculata]
MSKEAFILAEKPMEFALDPSEVSTTAIGRLVTRYQATDVLPPPEDFIVVSDQAKAAAGGDSSEGIPATVSVVANVWDKESLLEVIVAAEAYRFKDWDAKFTVHDPEPVVDEFRVAGFARVVVPVRRDFEGSIDHFMQFGETWNGGPLPSITSGQYLPIAEIVERTGNPEGERPQGESWDVVVPTTLVKSRPDDRLLTWHKDEKGNWVPDANV